MRKKIFLFAMLLALCLLPGRLSQATELIEINEVNFPSEALRSFAEIVDQDKDGKLSQEERNAVKEMSIGCGDYGEEYYYEQGKFIYTYVRTTVNKKYVCGSGDLGENQKLSLKGIEYFDQLQKLYIRGYRFTDGSLQNNKKLTNLMIGDDDSPGEHSEIKRTADSWEFGTEQWKQFKERFPLPQIRKLCFGCGYQFDSLSLKEATNLEELQFGCHFEQLSGCIGPFQITNIEKLDVSANKKLKSLILRDTETEVIDLRKNKKMEKLIVSGKYKRQDFYKKYFKKQPIIYKEYIKHKAGKVYTMYDGDIMRKFNEGIGRYDAKPSLDIKKIKVAKDNKIKHLEFAVSKKIPDLSDFHKLTYLQVKGGEKMQISKKVYERYKKKKLSFYVRGSRTKFQKVKIGKNKVSVKAPLLKDRSFLYDRYFPSYGDYRMPYDLRLQK